MPALERKVADFELPDSTWTRRRLSELAADGPLVRAFLPRVLVTVRPPVGGLRGASQRNPGGSAKVVAVSADAPNRSEVLPEQLLLPFPILCDTGRRVVQEWDIYDPHERGGIAKPVVFIIYPDRRVLYAAVDSESKRIPASEIIQALKTGGETRRAKRKRYIRELAIGLVRCGMRFEGDVQQAWREIFVDCRIGESTSQKHV